MSNTELGKILPVRLDEMSAADFNRKHYRRKMPLHVTNTTAGWKVHRWSPDYLRAIVGHRLVDVSNNDNGVYDYNEHSTTGVVRKKRMTFASAIDLILSDTGAKYYIQQQEVRKFFPELLKDLGTPALLDKWKIVDIINMWFGGKGCKTPLHYDHAHNFLVQVAGRKRVIMFCPDQLENLYPAIDELLPHCSRVNVFAAEHSSFPKYAAAASYRMETILEPGDTLYIPVAWWHAVESLEASISLNFWWRGLT